MRILIFFIALMGSVQTAFAEISGPTTSGGTFTLTHDLGELREVDGSRNVIAYPGVSPNTFTKQDGTYYFEEWTCANLPYGGNVCFPVDFHTVTVNTGGGGGTTYPEPLEDQAQYDFEIRSGDYDSDGRVDVYVKRLSSGPLDGSMQSYILWNDGNGQVTQSKVTPQYLATANASPINTTLNLMPTDLNIDGYADHVIEHLDMVMANNVEEEFAVVAPGLESDKSQPAGGRFLDANMRSFYGDLGQWLGNQSYFAQNVTTTQIPIFAVGYVCLIVPWDTGTFGFFGGDLCFPYVYVVGYQTVQYGVNFSAVSASTHVNSILGDVNNINENDMWLLSQVIKTVIGVHAFGFDDSGTKRETNHDVDAEDVERSQIVDFILQAAIFADDLSLPSDPTPHDYRVNTPICEVGPSQPWCTLLNIACWARHYHAPRDDGNYSQPAEDGDYVELDGPGLRKEPIRVGVGADSGLPPNAIANVTEPGHIFEDEDGPGFGPDCPVTVTEQGDGVAPAADECSQLYREPDLVGNEIIMRTRGTGDNKWGVVNQVVGPWEFEAIDELMKEAILNSPDGICPSL